MTRWSIEFATFTTTGLRDRWVLSNVRSQRRMRQAPQKKKVFPSRVCLRMGDAVSLWFHHALGIQMVLRTCGLNNSCSLNTNTCRIRNARSRSRTPAHWCTILQLSWRSDTLRGGLPPQRYLSTLTAASSATDNVLMSIFQRPDSITISLEASEQEKRLEFSPEGDWDTSQLLDEHPLASSSRCKAQVNVTVLPVETGALWIYFLYFCAKHPRVNMKGELMFHEKHVFQ